MSQTSLRSSDNVKAKPESAQQTDPANPTDDTEREEGGNRFLLFNVMPSWMVSFIAHIAIIIILAILVMPSRDEPKIALEAGEQAASVLDDVSLDLSELSLDSEDPLKTDFSEDEPMPVADEIEATLPEADVEFEFGDFAATSEALDSAAVGEMGTPNETSSRSGEAKQRALKRGASAGSEESVALALKWIVDHQLPDGGWNLDHTIGPGGHRDSPDPGTRTNERNGATALALLPLLGAGHTHLTGQYKDAVAKGLSYLKKNGRRNGRGISYLEQGGSMYSHGLVAIVFCEAYAMTKDPELLPYAQNSVWFIEDAQDPVGGGWRYRPRERGDTSAVGWQLMALKSAKISGLDINPRTYKRTEKFLDSVSSSGGAFYGYMDPPRRGAEYANARTAIGLLCRMYMGWDKQNPGLIDGSSAIAEEGPSTGSGANMYYNYYATQVMMHMGDRDWKDWNVNMRDFLIKSQSTQGNATGSWHFNDGHASIAGGRLYNTSLACMTLEVYYRFLPIYGNKAANDEFQLIE